MKKNTKPIIEGGILAAIAIVMALLGVYLPILGIAFILTWSVTLIVLAVRYDLKWSILVTIFIAILVAVLTSPVYSMLLVLVFGTSAITIGQCVKRGSKVVNTLILSSVVSIISLSCFLILGFLLTGINPVEMQEKFINQVGTSAISFYQQTNSSEDKIMQIKNEIDETSSNAKILLPLVIILAGTLTVWLNYKIATIFLGRMGINVEPIPSFTNWRFSTIALYASAYALIGMYWGTTREIYLLKQLSFNTQEMAKIMMLLQGLSLFYYLSKKYNLSNVVWSIILVLIFSNNFILQTIVIAGACDMIVNYRNIINNSQK